MAEPLLSRADLDELGDHASAASAADLVEAASAGRVADPADAGYAYLLAAEIHARADDLTEALALAERALAAYRGTGTGKDQNLGRPRAYRAQLLLQLGRVDAAMAELTDLRPLMVSDALAAAYVPEALEAGGRAETALQWLTAALGEMTSGAADPLVAEQLAATRDRIRAGAEDPAADPYEADPYQGPELADDPYDLTGGDPLVDADAVLLVWPEEAYEQVDLRWPEVLEPTGAESWEEYRQYCQAFITDWARRSRTPLLQVTGDADEFEEWLAEQGVDPYRTNLVALAREYGDHLAAQSDPVELPPAPDDPCWCGSGVSYAECCRPLSP